VLSISPPPSLDLGTIILILVIVTIGISALGIASYRVLKKMRQKRIEKTQDVYNQYIDLLNLEFLMVIDKQSGLPIYTQNFSGGKIDDEFISGILQAVQNSVDDLRGLGNKGQSIRKEYKDLILIITDFVNLRLILITRKSPSKYLIYSIEQFAYDIYKNYGNLIDSFNGETVPFTGIEDLLRQHFNPFFLYPVKLPEIDKIRKVRLTQNEMKFVNKAVDLMKAKNQDYFYIRDLMSEKEFTQSEKEIIKAIYERIKRDNDDNDFYPYPYIFKPPSPPDDLGLEGVAQPKDPPPKKEPGYNPYCKFCGADLPIGQLICHVCGNKLCRNKFYK
jgi:hypothetical protein